MLYKYILFLNALNLYFCFKSFTIDSEGKNIITTKVTNFGECTSIAITQKGSFIKYKSDSSIISSKKYSFLEETNNYEKSFLCQSSSNKIILTRDNKITEIILNSDGDPIDSPFFTFEENEQITFLYCNINLNKYIITYLTEGSTKYNFKTFITIDNPIDTYTSDSPIDIVTSSCLLLESSLFLCINILSSERKIQYFYHNINQHLIYNGEIDISGNNYKINGGIIKYWSNNEIMICLNSLQARRSDINLICYMINAIPSENLIQIKNQNVFLANEKVTNNINYCQIEKLSTNNLYVSICLTFYYRTTYLLSIFKFNNNEFTHIITQKDIEFSLLTPTSISIIPFNYDSLGIFYKDLDNDSMLLMFFSTCNSGFDYAPKDNINTCELISDEIDNYYYDECTHIFKTIPTGYSIYKRNQFCNIKQISCDEDNDYILDDNNNFGTYECWPKSLEKYYYVTNTGKGEFKNCFRSCLRCHGEGTESDNNCDECNEADGFYGFQDIGKARQCQHKDEPLNGYFFDDSQNKFITCRRECLTCNEIPTNMEDNDETNENGDTKCLKCKINDNYWPQVGKITNCINKDLLTIRYYYAFSSYQSWEKCFTGCRFCKELGESKYDTRCDGSRANYCSDGYFQVENSGTAINDRANCFKGTDIYNHYYLDNNVNVFKRCNEACLQCNEFGSTTDETKCTKCNELNNYYPNEDNPSICYKYDLSSYLTDSFPHYYYFDLNTKKFRKCHKSCYICKEQNYANDDDTQCKECNNNYYKLENSEIGKLNCYHKDRKGYYLFTDSTDGQIMKKCPERCASCIYASDITTPSVKCKECDNSLGFYELENPNNEEDSRFKDCRTLRVEKINSDNLPPPVDTILVDNIFKYCDQACQYCTALSESIYQTHCQAKKCKSNYYYIFNYEDICYPGSENLLYYFLYDDPILSETYFKPCYETCETCSQSGNKQNNNCNTCRIGYILHPNQITNPNNCVFDCLSINNYFYLDEDNNDEYICVDKCPDKYPYLQPNKKQCLKSCRNEAILKYSRDRVCVGQCPSGTQTNNFEECVSVSNNCIKSELESNYILHDINNENINDFIINYCQDYSFTSQQITVIKNKLEEYKIFIYKKKDCIDEFFGNNINFPDLSVCFDELKKINNINKNQDLIIMIMNIYNKHSSIRVEYKIFNSITCEELNLNDCSQKNISTNINLNNYFDENKIQTAKKMYDKGIIVYDRSAPFFIDICYEYNAENDRDMILEDRVDQFYQDVTNICEDNCHTNADFEKNLLKCICELKSNFLEKKDENNKEKYTFGVRAISLQVMKCAKKAFLWDYFKTNIGSYTALVLIAAEIPLIVFFIKYGLSQVKIFLIPFMGSNPPKNSLIGKKVSEDENENSNNINKDEEEEEEYEEYEEEEKEFEKESNNINNDNYSNSNNKNEINNENKYSEIEDISNRDKTDTEEVIDNSNIDNSSKSSREINDKKLYNQRKNIKKKNYDIYKEIKDNDDINDIELFDAITFDKRSFCQFYWDELKRTQPIIYSFIIHTPLTPRYFKILLFIFNTIICFEFNAFFYSKTYISNKYYDFQNNFSWYINNIFDRIILTCICTIFLNLFIRVLTNSKKKLQMWVKREKDREKFNKEIIYMINKMYLNYIIFMIVQGVFMFFFWIYLSCFCNCYKNNEIEWFVTSLICFGIIQIWYFISTFIVTCLRLIGIRYKMESCYNVSLCLAYD